ncbi:ankyrin repeat [Paramyrothecium foliicola]|nr:ankyrin repeat [Paramyrothecium foliicola]
MVVPIRILSPARTRPHSFIMATADLPQLPAPHQELVSYIAQNPDTPMTEIMEPYRNYEAQLRTVYAQDRQNPILEDPYLNVIPLFTDKTKLISTRARDLASESEEEASKYIMALPESKRRPHGSPATVADFAEFQKNFNIFSETSLAEVDWNNVVAAGSSVVNCLLPVPDEFKGTKRKLREYYHEKFCPASDVDLFLYGLTHDEAIEKIKQIEQAIKDALLNEVTVVRTKYAITIASQYPVRHVQIVLRVYKSISEILTGFDIDAAGGAFDGKQVWVTPRALGSFITQINHVDLSRRSPSYENRLSKYSHRNFEVYWPELERSRVDPTIFERSFGRTLGLARLLVLERLPTHSTREAYLNKRRAERGRPTSYRSRQQLRGNLKDYHEDEVADWLSEEDVSNYHTFTVPYGEHFNAKRIEKLCYTRDLLLNAEWNQSDKREVYLHRHPAFFGRVQDVIEDCCGSCPEPKTPEEIEVAKKEAEIYISGKVSFLIDDPGRQQIGSFNPLTEQDWTDMAYVGNTARLCQSIVDGDVDDVLNWLAQDGADPNQCDYTGRSPLHLAVMCSTSDVVKCLVDHGARLTARLADGKTALHLAAWRGEAEMIKTLMEKSIENEEMEEAKKQAKRRDTRKIDQAGKYDKTTEDVNQEEEQHSESDGEMIDGAESAADDHSIATGSFVNIKKKEEDGKSNDDLVPEESDDDPDYYQIDVLAWDVPCSPLHLAISEGHEAIVELLCDYGADSILPVKFSNEDDEETAAILTLVLALSLSDEKAKSMARLLLKLGAISSQAESNGITAMHRYIASGNSSLVDVLLDADAAAVKSAVNHLFVRGYYWDSETISPLHSAIMLDNPALVRKLLEAGAPAHIDFETWLKAARLNSRFSRRLGTLETNQERYAQTLEQPLITAIRQGRSENAIELLERGADPNSLTSQTQSLIHSTYQREYNKGRAALDLVEDIIENLSQYTGEGSKPVKPQAAPGIDTYLESFQPGTYQHWIVSEQIISQKKQFEASVKAFEEESGRANLLLGVDEKLQAINEIVSGLKKVKDTLIAKGARPFTELRPDVKTKATDNLFTHHSLTSTKQDSSKPYEYHFSFINDKEMTESRRDGYVQLMEAAWTGNLEQIKALTLHAWGSNQDQPPLKIAASDTEHNSPFSVAFLRGHYDVAQAILEIMKAQWSPPEKLKYKMEADEADSEEEYDSEYESDEDEGEGDQPRITSTKVDRMFTIDNIGQVSTQVESHTKPLGHLCDTFQTFRVKDGEVVGESITRDNLFAHVIKTDNLDGLKALLDIAQHYSNNTTEEKVTENSSEEAFDFPQAAFLGAIEKDKIDLLKYAIKRTGAGIPLDHLVKKSGVEMKVKPKFYQGLTVYGKKRKDWANAGRNMAVKTSGLQTPPLLHAALGGSLESVEFFLSDAPHRLYGEFGKSKAARDDVRLKHLKDSPGGFDRSISKWLGAENDLVIHCAVMATPENRSYELLEYLVETYPQSLEKKTTTGDTPLMIACRLGRLRYVELLLKANADQSTKNANGENIVHAAIAGVPTAHRLRPLLELFDKDLRSHLFQQRNSLQNDGLTPLHAWIIAASGGANSYNNSQAYSERKDAVEVLKLLLEYSQGCELSMLNAAGDTCLHTAIMRAQLALVKAIVDFQPRLLYRENAVGPANSARKTYELDEHKQLWTRPLIMIDRSYAQAVSVVFELGVGGMKQGIEQQRVKSRRLGNENGSLGSAVSPDANHGHGKAKCGKAGPNEVTASCAVEFDPDLLAVELFHFLLAGGLLAVNVAEDLVAGLHGTRASRRGLLGLLLGRGAGRGLRKKAGCGDGEDGEQRCVDEVRVASRAGREEVGDEQRGRGERREGENRSLERGAQVGEGVGGRG